MPDSIRPLCNKCYQPLETVEYPEGMYIEPCGCVIEMMKDNFHKELDKAWEEGFYEGKNEEEQDHFRVVNSLEREIVRLENIIDDDEQFNKRMGL